MSATNRIVVVLASVGAVASLRPSSTDTETTVASSLQEAAPLAQLAPEPAPSTAEQTALISAQHPLRRPVALSQQPTLADRDVLARHLQRELKRVGCYTGQLHGIWTTSTRRAMRAFNDNVNAVLPTHAPDLSLLALVHAHPERVCGTPCPAGQGLSSMGQCIPSPLLARRAGPKVAATMPRDWALPTISAWTSTPTLPVPAQPADVQQTRRVGAPPRTAASAPKPVPRRAAEMRQHPHSRPQRSWANYPFRQKEWLGFN